MMNRDMFNQLNFTAFMMQNKEFLEWDVITVADFASETVLNKCRYFAEKPSGEVDEKEWKYSGWVAPVSNIWLFLASS